MGQDCLKTSRTKSSGSKLPMKSWKDDKEHVIRNGLICLIKIRKMKKQLSNWRLSLISNARPTPSFWIWLKSESSKPTCRLRNYIQIYKKTPRSKLLSTWPLKSTSSTTKDVVSLKRKTALAARTQSYNDSAVAKELSSIDSRLTFEKMAVVLLPVSSVKLKSCKIYSFNKDKLLMSQRLWRRMQQFGRLMLNWRRKRSSWMIWDLGCSK